MVSGSESTAMHGMEKQISVHTTFIGTLMLFGSEIMPHLSVVEHCSTVLKTYLHVVQGIEALPPLA